MWVWPYRGKRRSFNRLTYSGCTWELCDQFFFTHTGKHPGSTKAFGCTASGKNISVWVEWIYQSERAPSELSETPRWRITLCPASRPRVALHIALRSPFCHFFPLCRSPISNKHSGVVPTVPIRRNGFIGYTLASGLQCNAWHCENLSPRSFYIERGERRKVRRYDTTPPWGSTKSLTARVRPNVGQDTMWIFIVW